MAGQRSKIRDGWRFYSGGFVFLDDGEVAELWQPAYRMRGNKKEPQSFAVRVEHPRSKSRNVGKRYIAMATKPDNRPSDREVHRSKRAREISSGKRKYGEAWRPDTEEISVSTKTHGIAPRIGEESEPVIMEVAAPVSGGLIFELKGSVFSGDNRYSYARPEIARQQIVSKVDSMRVGGSVREVAAAHLITEEGAAIQIPPGVLESEEAFAEFLESVGITSADYVRIEVSHVYTGSSGLDGSP